MQQRKEKLKQALKKLERYTHTDMVYLVRHTSVLSATHVFKMTTAFVSLFLFANYVVPETYGTYKYVLSFLGFLVYTALPGMNSTVVREVAKHNTAVLRFARNAKIRHALMGTLGCWAIGAHYFSQDNATLGYAFGLLGLFLPFYNSFRIYQSRLSGKKQFSRMAQNQILIEGITFIGIVLTIFFTDHVLWLVTATLAFPLAVDLYTFKKIRKEEASFAEPNPSTKASMLRLAKQLTGSGMLAAVAAQVDKLLIFHYLGATELAIYSVAVAPAEQMKFIFRQIAFIAFPKFAEKPIQEIKKSLYKKITLAVLLGFVGALIYAVIAPLAFRLFFPAYEESIFLSQVFALSVAATPLLLILSVFESHRRIKELYTFHSVSSIVQIVLLIILTGTFGLIGAVTARVIARFFHLASALFFLKRAR